MMVGGKQLDEPIFDDGFSITPRNAYNGNMELFAMVGCNLLEGINNIVHLPQVDVGIIYLMRVWYNKGADSTTIEVINIPATGVAGGRNGKKERVLWVGKTATISQQMKYIGIGLSQ